MERWNRQKTINRHGHTLIAACLCTPFIATAAFAAPSGSSNKMDSAGALPPAPHTVQEDVGDAGALPPPVTKRYVKLKQRRGTGMTPWYIALDLSTPWSLGYIQTYAQPSIHMSPWGAPFYNDSPLGN